MGDNARDSEGGAQEFAVDFEATPIPRSESTMIRGRRSELRAVDQLSSVSHSTRAQTQISSLLNDDPSHVGLRSASTCSRPNDIAVSLIPRRKNVLGRIDGPVRCSAELRAERRPMCSANLWPGGRKTISDSVGLTAPWRAAEVMSVDFRNIYRRHPGAVAIILFDRVTRHPGITRSETVTNMAK